MRRTSLIITFILLFAVSVAEGQTTADALYRLTVERFYANDWDGTIANSDKFISLNTGDLQKLASVHVIRSQARFEKNDMEGATTDCTKAMALRPKYDMAYYQRARYNLILNKGDAAYKDALKYIEINGVSDTLNHDMVIVGYFGLREAKQNAAATKFLETWVKQLTLNDWKKTIFSYLSGALTEQQFLTVAGVNRASQAHVYIGMNLSLEEDHQAALPHLRAVKGVSTYYINSFLLRLAQYQLQRLEGLPTP